jgi:hypothetical protein
MAVREAPNMALLIHDPWSISNREETKFVRRSPGGRANGVSAVYLHRSMGLRTTTLTMSHRPNVLVPGQRDRPEIRLSEADHSGLVLVL